MADMDEEEQERLITVSDLAERWNVTRRTAREYTLEHNFPKRVLLTSGTWRWVLEEVEEWDKHNMPRRRRPRTRKHAMRFYPDPPARTWRLPD
jgi:predicted DNA-binding transcriptional regulator AlpA